METTHVDTIKEYRTKSENKKRTDYPHNRKTKKGINSEQTSIHMRSRCVSGYDL